MPPKPISPSLEEPPSPASNFGDSPLKNQSLSVKNDLIGSQVNPSWRISPEPFGLSAGEYELIRNLGPALLKFYKAQNRLYFESLKGNQPPWISFYLDLGKPQQIVDFGRMNRFKSSLPGIIRPDLILTQENMIISELDSVPGGFGLTHLLNRSYAKLGYDPIGGEEGMTNGFRKMVMSLVPELLPDSGSGLGLVVSEESRDYLPEMAAFVRELNRSGLSAYLCRPEELYYSEEGVFYHDGRSKQPLTFLYRFLELFDLPNIPKTELLLYATKKEKVATTPPVKAQLEEKMWFAFFHHPLLDSYWEQELGNETYRLLKAVIPKTWILDPRPLPPYGIIPDLTFRGKPVSEWRTLFDAGQKERRLVIKPSGFSELAWGSRGVRMGHDLSGEEWRSSLEGALGSFYRTPHLLQDFHQGRKAETQFLDEESDSVVKMVGRTRLCPYYFVTREGIELGGILATTCPSDKKIIHGMSEAVMAPCRIKHA